MEARRLTIVRGPCPPRTRPDRLLLAAALVAGAVNAVAGGGSLLSFPALLAVGYPALTANVTNTVALTPGYLGGTLGYRRELEGQRGRALALGAISAVGGRAGRLPAADQLGRAVRAGRALPHLPGLRAARRPAPAGPAGPGAPPGRRRPATGRHPGRGRPPHGAAGHRPVPRRRLRSLLRRRGRDHDAGHPGHLRRRHPAAAERPEGAAVAADQPDRRRLVRALRRRQLGRGGGDGGGQPARRPARGRPGQAPRRPGPALAGDRLRGRRRPAAPGG